MLAPQVDPIEVRMRISMVFQKPNPFPKSIFENVAYGLKVRGEKSRSYLRGQGRGGAEGRGALGRGAATGSTRWRSTCRAASSSGCASRARSPPIPEIILFDEPTSALDPIATGSIEELIGEIKQKVTVLIVTHNMQQAARVSDFTAYMYLGELIEYGDTTRHLHEAAGARRPRTTSPAASADTARTMP